jgi:A/G-specific adenine glycosylase
MLQQTQVTTVLGYYQRFLDRFPTVETLANAPLEDVLALWAGLGYYARARQAHRCAQVVTETHGGQFPERAVDLQTLPGIGPSTAAAIASFCHGEQAAILDGNVKRVLARHAAIHTPLEDKATLDALWNLARTRLPASVDMPAYTQAIMDLGASVCGRNKPQCTLCPVQTTCEAHQQGVAGQLPARRVRAVRPSRQALWLVLRQANEVLMEQRPPQGLWGGMLSLPQFSDETTLMHTLQHLGLTTTSGRKLPERRHVFTHFSLTYTPWVLETTGIRPESVDVRWRWVRLTDRARLALPAPVARLLDELDD